MRRINAVYIRGMTALLQDLRYGMRMLGRQPGFTVIAVLTLALGIGANTAIFSVVNAVLLRPLPYREPERLVKIWETNEDKGGAREMSSISNLLDWQSRNRSFQEIAAWQRLSSITLTGESRAAELTAGQVTANFFSLLGVDAAIGRTFVAEEGKPGGTRVAVLSRGLWQRGFGADPKIVSKQIQFEKVDFQVVGVMPADFKSPAGDADLWLPMNLTPNNIDRGQTYLQAIARLKPGITLDQAQSDANSMAAELARQFPASNRGRGLMLLPLLQETVGSVRPALLIIFTAVMFVLLIACANVANLFLVRAAGREREMAVRSVLGATRFRVIQQLITESVLVFAAGGLLGILTAWWTLKLLQAISPGNIPRLDEVGIDASTILFTSVVSLLTGIIFGLAPALYSFPPDINASLKEGKQSPFSGIGRHRLQATFVIVQIAFALVLLIGAGLMVNSFVRLRSVPPGFDFKHLLVVRMFLDDDYREDHRQVAFFRDLTRRLESLPGVGDVGAVTVLPMNPFGIDFDVPWYREGEMEPQRTTAPKAKFRSATPEYFQAIGIQLLRGRAFSDRDLHDSPRVVIVNQSLADRAWPGENPVGKRLRFFWADWQTYEVIGVAGNTKTYGPATDWQAELFVPHAQIPYTVMNVVIRTAYDPAAISAEVRRAILEMDASQPPHSITTMEELYSRSLARERFSMMLLEILSGLALLLAVIGLYGVLAYTVTQRTREIGIRLALGAQTENVLKLVIKQGMRLVLAGIGIGLVCAFTLTRAMEGLLFGVSRSDPTTFTGVVLLFSVVALLACYIPARRAMKVDPMVALRCE